MRDICFKDGDTVVFIGDSITDCDSRGLGAPLGGGYVRMVVRRVEEAFPERKITWYNRGISGDTVLELQARWAEDALALKPDWLSVMIGINDLHQHLEGRPGLSPGEYKAALDRLLRRAVDEAGCRLILLDPFYMALPPGAEDYQRPVLALLPEYIAAVDELAEAYAALHVKTHEAFRRVLESTDPAEICEEPVHPNPRGHEVIAEEFLRVCEAAA